MTHLNAEEILEWNDTTAKHWRALFEKHPEALALPCDVRSSNTVADLVQHITAAELRYAQQLCGELPSDYADLPKSTVAELFQIHDTAIAKYRTLLADPAYKWDEEIRFITRSEGPLIAPRRTIMFHGLLHSIRHYAQLATLMRHAGIAPDWHMDYLFMAARRA